MGKITVVLGGARSGKSAIAEELLHRVPTLRKGYIATSRIWDEEMEERVRLHRLRRPKEWELIEFPEIDPTRLSSHWEEDKVILFDCVTMYVNNYLMDLWDWSQPTHEVISQVELKRLTEQLISHITTMRDEILAGKADVIFVSNELGLGIVPDNPLSRIYRDLVGTANQLLVTAASSFYFVVAGVPLIYRKEE